jgi:CubicO group peptidase (beta-lactamase class C family)
MKKILLFFSLGFYYSLSAQTKLTDRIDALIQTEVSAHQLSAVVLVADHGKPIYRKAVGYRSFAEQTPLQPTDVFELASVSKQFTAMVIMLLQEQGKLQYDDPVEQYLSIPYKGITIRHLLTHTSGLPDYQAIMDQYWDKSKVAGNTEILEYLNRYAPPALFAPGTKYNYSNTGYVLLASIAEKASGRDFIEFCTKEIFRRLGMRKTAIRTLTEKAAVTDFATGHIYVKESNRFVRADSFPASDYTIWLGNRKGPGRISSTADDLLKWDQALYTDKLIHQRTLEQAYTPMTLNDGTKSNYGFGWELISNEPGNRITGHSGDNPGYKTKIVRLISKQRTLIVLCNNAAEGFDTMIKNLTAILAQ